MKTVNLKSLISIYNSNGGRNISSSYMNYLGGQEYKVEIKENELNPLKSLIESLEKEDDSPYMEDYNGFYLNYKIPQIGKEFDLLRITPATVLSIEYKREVSDYSKIINQALRNYYYLKFLKREVVFFIYIENTNSVYKLNKEKELIQSNFKELIGSLKYRDEAGDFYDGNLNEIFKPSNYLISPFGKTQEFIDGEYFLTQEQEDAEQKVIKHIEEGNKLFLIVGEAGSGKTLLVYHLAKMYSEIKPKIGLIHCGNLNSGHEKLKSKFGWNIEPIKNWENLFSNGNVDIVLIDEFQRINEDQFKMIYKKYIKDNNTILIMSGDRKQTLKNTEGQIFDMLNSSESSTLKIFKLKGKVRTNKALSNFIKVMLDLSKKHTLKVNNHNIDITYFDSIEEANTYISSRKKYDYIAYTPSMHYQNKLTDVLVNNPNSKGTAHQVIGQEFENVIVVIDRHFYYDNKKLRASTIQNNPYNTLNMFFQQITRAINKIEIVVVKNKDVFNNLIGIFDADD